MDTIATECVNPIVCILCDFLIMKKWPHSIGSQLHKGRVYQITEQ